jgi:hypothetical protein
VDGFLLDHGFQVLQDASGAGPPSVCTGGDCAGQR